MFTQARMRMDEPRAPQTIRNHEEEQRYHKKQFEQGVQQKRTLIMWHLRSKVT
jgi:hypothetical protein